MIMAETIKIICHPNTSGQLLTAKVELYHRYGVHSIVIWHYIYLCCRAQRKSLRYRPCGLVYINTPGYTCLHEVFTEYKASHSLGSPVFFQIGGKLSSTAVCTGWLNGQAHKSPPLQFWFTSNRQLEGTIGRVADTARTGSFITRRSHLNFLWIHIALSTSMIYTFSYGQTRRISSQLLESPWDSGATMTWLSKSCQQI